MKEYRSLTLILGGLAMLGPFSIDTYLPSFAVISADFGVAPIFVQQTLSAYLLCFAGMMLFHGTLSDSFGRRPVILASLGVFTLASLGAAFAPNLSWLIAFRALQGLSAGAGTVVGRAMIRDRLADAPAQKMLSNVTLVFAIAPAIAPILGGWLQVWLGWRSIFAFLAITGAALGVISSCALPESLPPAKRHVLRVGAVIRNYLAVVSHARFLLLVFSLAFASIGYFVYVASAPRFLPEVLGLSETQFGWLFLPIVSGMMAGAVVAGRLAAHWRPARLLLAGYLMMGGAAVANLACNVFLPAQIPWAVLPLFAYTFGVALSSPTMMLSILNVFPAMRGLAASVQAFVQTLLYAAVAAVIAPAVAGSGLWLALFEAATAALSLACIFLARRAREPDQHDVTEEAE